MTVKARFADLRDMHSDTLHRFLDHGARETGRPFFVDGSVAKCGDVEVVLKDEVELFVGETVDRNGLVWSMTDYAGTRLFDHVPRLCVGVVRVGRPW